MIALFVQVLGKLECHKTSDRGPWLLPVQVALTPGLYPGPGVYAGAGFYRKFYGMCMCIGMAYVHLVSYRENLPSHFKYKEYCPVVFRKLRERFGINEQDYLVIKIPISLYWFVLFIVCFI